ncbi:DUF1207 domain-containing protein [Methylomonas paludis]|uniref:DUF1207 domain-containing protein n=1 Tax=Methylomonas paludis TaxID=1173101 RepID=A0A975MK93_9GAMM|nr:DUF1207 domain-containing protein [Methylomonas paludis]QWF69398.1 DUF1207 domain-containing protein [Methylomonas paludis]
MSALPFLRVAALLLPVTCVQAVTSDDAYLSGYATGVLNHELRLDLPALQVNDGVIILPMQSLAKENQTRAAHILAEIPGIKAVKLSQSADQQPAGSITTTTAAATAVAGSQTSSYSTQTELLPTGILPVGLLFKPLIADPRWAHFSATYRNYQSNNFVGRDTVSVSFGETIPFYRGNLGKSSVQWETGMQAGVFSDFNMDTASHDLVNTDFIASGYGSLRAGQFSLFGRLYHQSSHVGDEFLLSKLNTNFQRVNLSYEGSDLKLSYELPYGVRVYGGGGGIVDKDPSTLKTWSSQYGMEFRSPWLLDFGGMRPIAAVDIKNFQQNNWASDLSARAGVEFNNRQIWGRKLQILAEYYDGYTPIGQFYKDKVQYLGLGAHFHF